MSMLIDFVQHSTSHKTIMWAIISKAKYKHIGNIKVDPINYHHGFGEYGILMGDKDEWGKGYAMEASLAVINKPQSLRKINLGVVKENI